MPLYDNFKQMALHQLSWITILKLTVEDIPQ